ERSYAERRHSISHLIERDELACGRRAATEADHKRQERRAAEARQRERERAERARRTRQERDPDERRHLDQGEQPKRISSGQPALDPGKQDAPARRGGPEQRERQGRERSAGPERARKIEDGPVAVERLDRAVQKREPCEQAESGARCATLLRRCP